MFEIHVKWSSLLHSRGDIVKWSLSGAIFRVYSLYYDFHSFLSPSHCVRCVHLFFAEGTIEREQQALKHNKYSPSCWRQDMKGHHGDSREDGLTLTDSWEEQPASRPKTNDARLDQTHWSRLEWLLERAADKGNKDRDTVLCFTAVVLLCGPLESDFCVAAYFHWCLMSILSSRHTQQRESERVGEEIRTSSVCGYREDESANINDALTFLRLSLRY